MENYSHRFQVNLAGMIDILSNHLYDEKMFIFANYCKMQTDAHSRQEKKSIQL